MASISSGIKDRVLQISDYKHITREKFFADLGMSYGNFKGKSKEKSLSSDALATIASKYPDINPEWLLTGKRPMLKEKAGYYRENEASREVIAYRDSYKKHYYPEVQNPKISDEKGVPYFDVDFIGGFDLVFNDQTIAPSFYIDFSPFNDADYWVNITGQSMAPIISSGDLVALKRVENWQEFILFGEVYALVTDEFKTIKVVNKGQDKQYFNLVPYNKSSDFFEQQIPKHLVRHVFKVKGSIKKFF